MQYNCVITLSKLTYNPLKIKQKYQHIENISVERPLIFIVFKSETNYI